MKHNRHAHTLVDMFLNSVSSFPQRTAFVFGAKKATYQDIYDVSMRLASALRRLGIGKGDKVCLWLPNCPEFVYSVFATLVLGATVVPVNSMFKREEAKFVVEDSGAGLLICSLDKREDAFVIKNRVDSLRTIICVSGENAGTINFYHLIEKNKPLDEVVPLSSDTIAEILYTSGTTGRPKGASLTHGNILANVKDCCEVIRVTPRDCFICILPLFHSFASTVCMFLPIYAGAKIVIMRTIRPFKRVIRAVFKQRVTVFVGVPSIYKILSEARISWVRLLVGRLLNPVRIFISGAAALEPEVIKKFEKKFFRPLLEGYGLTEASPVVSLNPLKGRRRKPGSVGVPLPSLEVKVVDSEGREVFYPEVGELIIKGPSVMKGYYHLEEETKRVIRDGWLYTGDLARIDDEGYIYIMGRSKEMINVRGLNVYPREIEEVLYKHPAVKEVAVVGVMHPHRGEVPVAFVVSTGEVTERQLKEYMRANLASYKVPLKVIFKKELPKNATGKILKNALMEEVKGIFK